MGAQLEGEHELLPFLLPWPAAKLLTPRAILAALKAKCGLAANYWSERIEFQRYRTTSYSE